MISLHQGDCLDHMRNLPDHSVDLILCDLPYGTTECAWDSVIPFDLLWEQYRRLLKPRRAIVLTAAQPFTTNLIASNFEMFKYCLVWEKTRATDFYNAKLKPLKRHEDIVVFSNGKTSNGNQNNMLYNPQGLIAYNKSVGGNKRCSKDKVGHRYGRDSQPDTYIREFTNYPSSIIKIASEHNADKHPTQKPVALMEYLIRTYSNEGDTVLDNCMGSGTTGVACLNTNRRFIGIEMNADYFNLARDRIERVANQPNLFAE